MSQKYKTYFGAQCVNLFGDSMAKVCDETRLYAFISIPSHDGRLTLKY